MTKDKINVCLACDDNYAKYAGVVIASILTNANIDDELAFFILDGGISQGKKDEINSLKSIKNCEIKFISINENLFEEYKKVITHKYLSIPAFYRLKISKLLPDTKKIIYLDCDIVVNSSLKELFNSDLSDCIIGGVKDINKRMLKKNPNYVNSGMLVMDLEKIKNNDVEHQFEEWTKQNIDSIKMGDQQIINEVLKGKIKILSDVWNVQSSNFINRSSYTNNPKIIHYVAKKKPWHFGSFSYHKNYYFKYLELTPWKLSEEEKKYWINKNKWASLFGYIKYRPLFMLRPRFYQALFCTYIKPLFHFDEKN